MAIDQAHEHANAGIKSEGGAISITEDASALRRWMVAGSEVSCFVVEYESLAGATDANESVRHYDQTEHAQRTFFEKVHKLCTTLKKNGKSLPGRDKRLAEP